MSRSPLGLAACAALVAACTPAVIPPSAFVTEAERSRFEATGRYAEVERMCHDFEAAYPGRARCDTFGVTPEGRPMLAIVASADGVLTPAEARERRRPVILFQGGIHAGEIDGKDGGLAAMRELLQGTLAPGSLQAATAVFVPVFNVDGHERFRKNQRPNQRGPVETGFRTTSQNLNLNRDYVKAEAPEMHAMLGLFGAWDPTVYVDLHTTDGARFQHDMAVIVAAPAAGTGLATASSQALSDALVARLTALGHLPVTFYPEFLEKDAPASGFSINISPPRFAQRYAGVRGRLGILLETHSWATNEQRVRAVHDLLGALFERAVTDAPSWRAAEEAADAANAGIAGAQVPLTFKSTDRHHPIEFQGFAYEKRASDVSGGVWTVYDETRPQVWRVPLFDELVPSLTVTAPRAGYVVPAAHAGWVAEKLRLHGVRFEVLPQSVRGFPVEEFKAEQASFRAKPYEGRTPVELRGQWAPARSDLPAGSLFVPIAQPRAVLVLHLFEPMAPDSLAAWGFFNASFERKEGMEDYVLEGEARRMLQESPQLRADFTARLTDPEFARSPEARLDFFYRRHPAYDERLDVVPVVKVDASPLAEGAR